MRETCPVFQRARQLRRSQVGTCLQYTVIYSHGRSLRVIYIYRQNSRRQFGICIQPWLFVSRAGSILFNVRPSICRIHRAKNIRYVLRNVINNANTSLSYLSAHLLICGDTDSSFSIMPLFKLVKCRCKKRSREYIHFLATVPSIIGEKLRSKTMFVQ